MAKTKAYRIQKRHFQGFQQRGWGFGKVASFGKWITCLRQFETLAEAKSYADSLAIGLSQVRVMFGKEVVYQKEG